MQIIKNATWNARKRCETCKTSFNADEKDIVMGRKSACFWGDDNGEPLPCVKCPTCGKYVRISMSVERAEALMKIVQEAIVQEADREEEIAESKQT